MSSDIGGFKHRVFHVQSILVGVHVQVEHGVAVDQGTVLGGGILGGILCDDAQLDLGGGDSGGGNLEKRRKPLLTKSANRGILSEELVMAN